MWFPVQINFVYKATGHGINPHPPWAGRWLWKENENQKTNNYLSWYAENTIHFCSYFRYFDHVSTVQCEYICLHHGFLNFVQLTFSSSKKTSARFLHLFFLSDLSATKMPQKHKQLKSGFCRNICLFNQRGTSCKHQEQVLRGSSARAVTFSPDGENRADRANMPWRATSDLSYWGVYSASLRWVCWHADSTLIKGTAMVLLLSANTSFDL